MNANRGFLDLSELGDFASAAIENDTVSFIAAYGDGRVFTCNKAFSRLTGYTKGEISAMRWPEDFTPPEQRHQMALLIDSVACDVAPYRYEKALIRKDGSLVPVDIFVHKFCDVAGAPAYFYSFITDISGHKRLEAELKKSESRYRDLVEGVNSVILQMDVLGFVTFFNSYAERFFGFSREEIAGRNVIGTIVPETESSGRDLAAMIRDIGRRPERYVTNENENMRKNGERVWISWTNRAIVDQDGNIVEILCVGNDITGLKRAELQLGRAKDELEERVRERTAELEMTNQSLLKEIDDRKAAEAALRKSEADLRHAQHIARLGNWEWDLVKDTGRWSEELYRIYGVSPDSFDAGFQSFLQQVHPDDRDRIRQSIDRSVHAGEPYNVDFRIILPDGRERFIHTEGTMSYDGSGRPALMFGTGQDVTERKLAEKALAEAKTEVELYLDLMGHDINNLNQVAMGFLELISEKLEMAGTLERADLQYISHAVRALNDSSRLIGNVRKLQKETRREAKPLVVDVTTVISEVKRHFEAGIDRDVAIRYTPHSSCRVTANELLADVFGNIVGNAIKHSEGPVSIVIEQRIVREDGQDYCRVAIEDDGPGIPDEQKRKVFARDNKEKARLTGKGLGLHLVRTLVDDYKGKIWVEDRVTGDYTKGARFVIMLPVAGPVG